MVARGVQARINPDPNFDNLKEKVSGLEQALLGQEGKAAESTFKTPEGEEKISQAAESAFKTLEGEEKISQAAESVVTDQEQSEVQVEGREQAQGEVLTEAGKAALDLRKEAFNQVNQSLSRVTEDQEGGPEQTLGSNIERNEERNLQDGIA